jgi:hypothetical protein
MPDGSRVPRETGGSVDSEGAVCQVGHGEAGDPVGKQLDPMSRAFLLDPRPLEPELAEPVEHGGDFAGVESDISYATGNVDHGRPLDDDARIAGQSEQIAAGDTRRQRRLERGQRLQQRFDRLAT